MDIKDTCHKCNGQLKFRFVQPALIKGKQDKVMVDCVNPQCELYLSTLPLSEHNRKRGV